MDALIMAAARALRHSSRVPVVRSVIIFCLPCVSLVVRYVLDATCWLVREVRIETRVSKRGSDKCGGIESRRSIESPSCAIVMLRSARRRRVVVPGNTL
jgi:hypothetical protein